MRSSSVRGVLPLSGKFLRGYVYVLSSLNWLFLLKNEMQTSLVINHNVSLGLYFVVCLQSTNQDYYLHGDKLIVSPFLMRPVPNCLSLGENISLYTSMKHYCTYGKL